MRPEENQGFTLIELLVVLAVVGLMMGVIGFSLLGGGGAELGASQRNVLGVLHQARTIAASTGVVTRIIISIAGLSQCSIWKRHVIIHGE